MNVEFLNARVSGGFGDADIRVDTDVRFTDVPYETFASSELAIMTGLITEDLRLTHASSEICLCHWPSPRLPKPAYPVPGIDRVIFNDPATIVIWLDGTKTIVKCQEGDTFDEQTGLALCFMKKALGNSSRKFNDTLHAYVDQENVAEVTENE